PDTAAATEPFEVTVRVSVPAATPTEPPLRLGGDIPELADGVMMVPDRLDPTLWSATVTVDTPTQARIWFDRGSDSTTSTDRHQVELTYPGQTVDLWVSAWQDMDGGIEPRPGFITGIYTTDWTAPQTFATVPATYRRIGAHNGGWVVVSSVAQYGQTQPLPQVELRPMRVAAAALPSYDIERHAALAGDAGLSVILGTQINMEMSPGGLDAVCSPQADGWWQAWLDEAEEVWMLHAAAAADAGIEAMVLPGHCFHVFPWEGHMGNPEVEAAFDQRVAAMIDEVRQVCPGRLIVSGSAPQFDFPALADLVGVTTYDTGHRDLPYNATVEEWTAAYDTLFADTVDPRWERWHRPVLFYTVHVPPHPDDQDPASGAVQARQLEAIFRAIEARPWVTGVLSWSYDWVDYPLASSDGVRARLAEAVLAKHYAMLGG
ncbi:MAG: hypothetical protein ACE5E8_07815, partial [Acidimicrobiia bacterium]